MMAAPPRALIAILDVIDDHMADILEKVGSDLDILSEDIFQRAPPQASRGCR
jgi:hypothetical protein